MNGPRLPFGEMCYLREDFKLLLYFGNLNLVLFRQDILVPERCLLVADITMLCRYNLDELNPGLPRRSPSHEDFLDILQRLPWCLRRQEECM